MEKSLVIRVDANAQVGTGHFMRCLALAQAWKIQGGQVIFISACESDGLRRRLSDEAFQIITLERLHPDPSDWETTSQVLASYPEGWVVLDGYHFNSLYQRRVKEAGHRLLVIDDMAHLEHYYGDVVLNQNINAEDLHYSCEHYSHLLLGTRYALLRSEFLSWREWKRRIPGVARKVLVTLGGGDPENITLKVINALKKVDIQDLNVKVVVGPLNPHIERLQNALNSTHNPISIVHDVEKMAELMAWADLAIAGGGATSWELAFMGLPHLVVVLADNQRSVAQGLQSRGVVVRLDERDKTSSSAIAEAVTRLLLGAETRAEMAQRGRKIVDGDGVTRVLMHLGGKKLRLRPIRGSDCVWLWKWANDPEVRAVAFSSDPIPWEEHVQWFAQKLHKPNCYLFIALDDQDIPVGQVRFDVDEEDEAEIDVTIDKSRRGSGYGSLLISMAVEEAFRVTPIRTVHAFIKLNNDPSIRAFEKAGFRRLGLERGRGSGATHYVRIGKQ